jgi:rod shape determining protein RodA
MGACFLLIAVGLISLFSLSDVSVYPFFSRQLMWVGIGLFLLVGASFIDFRIFKTQSFVVLFIYIVVIFFLLVVLFGNFSVRGVESWLRVGNTSFQPVELAKLSLILLLAKFFSKRHIEIYRLSHLFVSAIYVFIPSALVLIQPDLGSAIVLGAIWVSIVLFSGMKIRHFLTLVFFCVMGGFAAWQWILAPYQQNRILSFLNPYADPQGSGYQMIQSMIAVGSGRLWGKGIGYGSQSHLNFLPEAETDFIFAAFAEEWGFIGVLVILTLLLVLLWRIIWIGVKASDNFSRLYTFGFAALIFTQSFIHIGMNLGVLPITGLTLPFVSYGGSSLVTLLIGVGILQNIKINSSPAYYKEDTVLI